MTQDEMERLVINHVDVIEQTQGYVVFTYKQVKIALISDVKHDRMRMISPITEYAKVTTKQKDLIMEANFHSALDARYASSNDTLYSAFIHPMSSLNKADILSAIEQVATLALTFDSSYSSGTLSFGGQ
ncbi:MAG: hypothetical protein HOM11_06660 [Methylococcales bacterium]|nr:hypothetical protein [Methylococcales bacterium]MBT7445118.1 hypothetical protein [Methylococcales bacterium]